MQCNYIFGGVRLQFRKKSAVKFHYLTNVEVFAYLAEVCLILSNLMAISFFYILLAKSNNRQAVNADMISIIL